MRTSDFSYHLPPDRIAQRPVRPRDSSRLLIYDRRQNETSHHVFHELPTFLQTDDVIVLNETKVIPARIKARKIPSGGKVEILLLQRIGECKWEVIVGGKGVHAGLRLDIPGGPDATVEQVLFKSKRILKFDHPILDHLEEIGEMPLPPYIQKPIRRPSEYQTIFARHLGSAAAPTAGLHFTDRLLQQINEMGVQTARVTLHIGLDTFAPVTEDTPQEHRIHKELCRVSEDAVDKIRKAKTVGGRIIAVGTTVVRALETASKGCPTEKVICPYDGYTSLYILPGYDFKIVDSVITNFHLPRSTLLMMISAFTGRKKLLELYRDAIDRNYRFYSFGDAMLIL